MRDSALSHPVEWGGQLLRREFRGICFSERSDARERVIANVSLSQYALLACAVVALSGCGSSSVEVLSAPTASRCGLTTTAPAVAFPAAGGSGMLGVTANRDCTWNVNSDAAWLIPDQASGQGEAVITFSVAANIAGTARRGALVIDGVRVDVAQDGVPCRFIVDRASVEIGGDGGVTRILVTTLPGCAWTARTFDPWITLIQSGEQVELSVAVNTGPARVGAATIAGSVVEVRQQELSTAASPTPAPAPVPSPLPAPVLQSSLHRTPHPRPSRSLSHRRVERPSKCKVESTPSPESARRSSLPLPARQSLRCQRRSTVAETVAMFSRARRCSSSVRQSAPSKRLESTSCSERLTSSGT